MNYALVETGVFFDTVEDMRENRNPCNTTVIFANFKSPAHARAWAHECMEGIASCTDEDEYLTGFLDKESYTQWQKFVDGKLQQVSVVYVDFVGLAHKVTYILTRTNDMSKWRIPQTLTDS